MACVLRSACQKALQESVRSASADARNRSVRRAEAEECFGSMYTFLVRPTKAMETWTERRFSLHEVCFFIVISVDSSAQCLPVLTVVIAEEVEGPAAKLGKVHILVFNRRIIRTPAAARA